jgi:hypothetical protein
MPPPIAKADRNIYLVYHPQFHSSCILNAGAQKIVSILCGQLTVNVYYDNGKPAEQINSRKPMQEPSDAFHGYDILTIIHPYSATLAMHAQ